MITLLNDKKIENVRIDFFLDYFYDCFTRFFRYYCFLKADEKNWPMWKTTLGWIVLAFAYILPFCIIVMSYSKILLHVRHTKITPFNNVGLRNAQLTTNKRNRLVHSLVLITALFSFAVLPVYFAMILFDHKFINAFLFYKIGIPTVSIIAINPLVYTLSNPSFSCAARRLFRFKG